MSPSGTIGAAAVIESSGNTAGEKANSAWKAKMINAAELTGKNLYMRKRWQMIQ